MTAVTVVVPGRPVSYARPAQNGKRRFTERKSDAHMRTVGLYANRAMAGRPPFTGRVRVEVEFYALPKTIKLADADNLAKAGLDGLSGIVFADDRQVWSLVAHKREAATAADERTVITVTALEAT